MQAGEHGWARRWTMKLVRDSGRVLNGAPQFVGRPEGELQWQADVYRVRPSRTSGFSACQVLWLMAGRSASRAAVCSASFFMCATHLSLSLSLSLSGDSRIFWTKLVLMTGVSLLTLGPCCASSFGSINVKLP
jgi:hypothetical protein